MTIHRTCSTCACFLTAPVPGEVTPQGMCRRFAPTARAVRIAVPVLKDGKPVMQRMDPTKPLIREEQHLAYVYELTQPGLTCFDGWRPLGSRPGMTANDLRLERAFQTLGDLIEEHAPSDLYTQIFERVKRAYIDEPAAPAATNDDAPPAAGLDS